MLVNNGRNLMAECRNKHDPHNLCKMHRLTCRYAGHTAEMPHAQALTQSLCMSDLKQHPAPH